jgi:hypothetical protein
MSKSKHHELSPEEQHVLEHGHLSLLTSPEDLARCDEAIIEHHYLHNVTLVGEHLRYAFIWAKRPGGNAMPTISTRRTTPCIPRLKRPNRFFLRVAETLC